MLLNKTVIKYKLRHVGSSMLRFVLLWLYMSDSNDFVFGGFLRDESESDSLESIGNHNLAPLERWNPLIKNYCKAIRFFRVLKILQIDEPLGRVLQEASHLDPRHQRGMQISDMQLAARRGANPHTLSCRRTVAK